MKKIIVLILCLISAFSLVGCGAENEKGQRVYKVYDDITLVCVASTEHYDILVHEETKVMYIKYYAYQKAGISVMLDENGKPLLWQGE